MLEDVKSEDAIENIIAKRKMVRIAHDIGVSKNFMFQLDAIRKTRCCRASSDMEDEIFSIAQDFFVLGSERIALVALIDDLNFFLGKYRDPALTTKERSQFAHRNRSALKTSAP